MTVAGKLSVEQVWNHRGDGRALGDALDRILGAVKAGGRGPEVRRAADNYRRAYTIALGDTDASGRFRATRSGGR